MRTVTTLPIDRLLTAEEFYALDNDAPCELVRGKVTEVSRPGPAHGTVSVNLVLLVGAFVQERRLGNVCANDTGYHIARNPDTVRGPDLGFVRQERLPAGGLPRRWELAPDLAVEVISPTDRWSEIEAKTQDWLAAGTEEVWLVDPERREVKVVRNDAPPRVLRLGETLTSAVLPGLAIASAAIFRGIG